MRVLIILKGYDIINSRGGKCDFKVLEEKIYEILPNLKFDDGNGLVKNQRTAMPMLGPVVK
jgi:hypothetical protein